MTLPASGIITLGDVATELQTTLPLSLGDSRVRALAEKPSGDISLSDLYGRQHIKYAGTLLAAAIGATSNGYVAPYWSSAGQTSPIGTLSGTTTVKGRLIRAIVVAATGSNPGWPRVYLENASNAVGDRLPIDFFKQITIDGVTWTTSTSVTRSFDTLADGKAVTYWSWTGSQIALPPGTSHSIIII